MFVFLIYKYNMIIYTIHEFLELSTVWTKVLCTRDTRISLVFVSARLSWEFSSGSRDPLMINLASLYYYVNVSYHDHLTW